MLTNLKSVVESLIFVADAPVSLDRLASVLEECDRADIRAAVASLQEEYDSPERGIVLEEVAGGYQFRSRPENADYHGGYETEARSGTGRGSS